MVEGERVGEAGACLGDAGRCEDDDTWKQSKSQRRRSLITPYGRMDAMAVVGALRDVERPSPSRWWSAAILRRQGAPLTAFPTAGAVNLNYWKPLELGYCL